MEKSSHCLEKLANEKITFYITKNINTNVNNNNQSLHATNYINATECNFVFHLNIKPTRVTDSSATTIDHITTNDPMHTIHPSIILRNLIDYHLIMCIITTSETKRKTKKRSPPLERQKIIYLLQNYLRLKLEELVLEQFPLTLDNFNKVYDQFATEIKRVISKHVPLKHLSRK